MVANPFRPYHSATPTTTPASATLQTETSSSSPKEVPEIHQHLQDLEPSHSTTGSHWEKHGRSYLYLRYGSYKTGCLVWCHEHRSDTETTTPPVPIGKSTAILTCTSRVGFNEKGKCLMCQERRPILKHPPPVPIGKSTAVLTYTSELDIMRREYV